MGKKFDKEIGLMELEARLIAQQHSKKVAELEIMKMKQRIDDLEITVKSLETAIAETTALMQK